MKLTTLTAVAVAALSLAGAANAKVYNWNFLEVTGTASGMGTFTTGGGALPTAITGVTGTIVDSLVGPGTFTITGLSSYAGADNILYATGTNTGVSFAGISVTTDTGFDFNIFGEYAPSPTTIGLLNSNVTPSGNPADGYQELHLNITAVPEPASWALMIAGFAMVGVAARRRQTSVVAA